MELAVSILGIKENLKEKIDELNKTKTSFLHIDIMDGKFVPNIHDNFVELEKSLKDNKKRIDVHLMVEDVERYVNIYKNIHPEYITFHYEISDSIHRIINIIKGNNIKVGLAIKPNTDISALLSYMDKLDLILIMSVEPGKGGQKYLLKSTDKINELYEIRKKYHYNFKIEVDGGINNETISNVQKADMVVVGSYITNSSNYEERINTIMER